MVSRWRLERQDVVPFLIIFLGEMLNLAQNHASLFFHRHDNDADKGIIEDEV